MHAGYRDRGFPPCDANHDCCMITAGSRANYFQETRPHIPNRVPAMQCHWQIDVSAPWSGILPCRDRRSEALR